MWRNCVNKLFRFTLYYIHAYVLPCNERIHRFAANLLSYIPTKYYWNRSTSDLVIAKRKRVNFFWNTESCITGCAVAQHCVNGDRPSQWEMANFDPSQNRNPWADCNKIPHNWLRPREEPLNQIWYKSIHWGLLGIWVKSDVFVPFLFIYLSIPFFWDSRTGQTGWCIFTRDSSLNVKSRKNVPFRGHKI